MFLICVHDLLFIVRIKPESDIASDIWELSNSIQLLVNFKTW